MQRATSAVGSIIAAVSLAACASSPSIETASLQQVMPGMTRQQVVERLGQPTGFSTGPNGMECLNYTVNTTPVSITPVKQTHVVVLQDGKVVRSETASPVSSWAGAQNAACGQPAPIYVPPRA